MSALTVIAGRRADATAERLTHHKGAAMVAASTSEREGSTMLKTQDIIDALVGWAMSGAKFKTDGLHRMALNVMVLETELSA